MASGVLLGSTDALVNGVFAAMCCLPGARLASLPPAFVAIRGGADCGPVALLRTPPSLLPAPSAFLSAATFAVIVAHERELEAALFHDVSASMVLAFKAGVRGLYLVVALGSGSGLQFDSTARGNKERDVVAFARSIGLKTVEVFWVTEADLPTEAAESVVTAADEVLTALSALRLRAGATTAVATKRDSVRVCLLTVTSPATLPAHVEPSVSVSAAGAGEGIGGSGDGGGIGDSSGSGSGSGSGSAATVSASSSSISDGATSDTVHAVALVVSGELRVGDMLMCRPGGALLTVTAVSCSTSTLGEPATRVPFNNACSIVLQRSESGSAGHSLVRPGAVLVPATDDTPGVYSVVSFEAQVAIMKAPKGRRTDVHVGDVFMVQSGSSDVPCRVTSLLTRIDRRTGLVSEQAPSQLLQGEFGMVALSPLVPMWCEAFGSCAALGRVSGVEDGAVCFVGVIKTVELGVVALVDTPSAPGHPGPEPEARRPSFDAAEVFEGTVEQAFELASSAEQLVALLAACGRRYRHGDDTHGDPGHEALVREVSGGEDAGTPWRWVLSDVATVSEVDVIAYAKRKREMQGEVWTGDVARALGQFLGLVRGK